MPRGGARPGAGRPPKLGNVIPFQGPRPTLGQALQALRPAPAEPNPSASAGPLPGTAPPGTPGQVPPAPTEIPPAPNTGTRTFCSIAARVGSGLGQMLMIDDIKRRGLKPRLPGDDDVELFHDSIEEGLREAFGDAPIPWWAGMVLGGGNLYLAMRLGAKRLKPKERRAEYSSPASSTTREAPTSPLGHARPIRPAEPDSEPDGSYSALPRPKVHG